MYSLSQDQEIALSVLHEIISTRNIQHPTDTILWILSWSTALVIQGVNVIPHDIDILTDKNWSKYLDQLLTNYCIEPSKFSQTEKYKSYFWVYNIQWIKVEIMGEMQYLQQDTTWSCANHIHPHVNYMFQGKSYPVLSLEQELKEYRAMGRIETVNQIKKRISF